MMEFRVVDLIPGSKQWHAWRRDGIGSSDASVLMGTSPWKSRERLIQEKLGLVGPAQASFPMLKGIAQEASAREYFAKEYQYRVTPACIENIEFPWLRSSLDGLHIDDRVVWEHKLSGKDDFELARSGKVPEKYEAQLQQILMVTGFKRIFYQATPFDGKPEPAVICVGRNQRYIKELRMRAFCFWELLLREKGNGERKNAAYNR